MVSQVDRHKCTLHIGEHDTHTHIIIYAIWTMLTFVSIKCVAHWVARAQCLKRVFRFCARARARARCNFSFAFVRHFFPCNEVNCVCESGFFSLARLPAIASSVESVQKICCLSSSHVWKFISWRFNWENSLFIERSMRSDGRSDYSTYLAYIQFRFSFHREISFRWL